MFKNHSLSIKNYVVILISVFVISSLVTNLFFLNTFNNIRINGSLYVDITESKDLKADILPPKLYIVDSYLLIHQIVNETNETKINQLLRKVQKSRSEYFKYYDYWKTHIKNKKLYDLLMIESHAYVVDFFKIYDEEFLPALKSKNTLKMQDIINNDMTDIFDAHRSIIDTASIMTETSNSMIEYSAESTANHSMLILFVIYGISLFFVLAISLLFFKRIKETEDKILQSQRETELANGRLESIITGLRRFKHNYDNTLASVKGYVMRDDMDGLGTYIDEIIFEKNQTEMKNYLSLDLLKNSGLMGLTLSKLIYAEKLNVDFNIIIENEIKETDLKTSLLCEALGILLDNAVEAAAESRDKKVSFIISDTQESLSFEIQNTTDAPPDRIKMFEKGWTTKGEHRGLGLSILKSIVSKNPNIILNTFVYSVFVKQELIISRNKKHNAYNL